MIPPAFGRHVARWLPSAEQIVLDGCGHVPQVERAEQTSELLERFFARVDALGAAAAPARSGRVDRGVDSRPRAVRRATAEPTARNGHAARLRAADASAPRPRAAVAGRAARAAVGAIARGALRVPAADLDERDPDYIRESLPRLWLLASL